MTSLQKFFGKKATPEEMVRKWQRDIRTEMRSLDRTITKTEIAEKQAIKDMKQAAQKNDVKGCKIFAKGLIGIRKQKQKLHTGKAQLNSINLQLQHQLATLKISGSLKKSTEVMKMVNGLTRIDVIAKNMQELSMEMTKAGMIDEMIQDTFDTLEEDDVEEEAEEEVNKVILEITDGLFGEISEVNVPIEPANNKEEEEEPELNEMQARLLALKS